jgi:hypothetical protein
MAAPLVVAVVHLIVSLEILALQVKSGPLPGSRLWLRPVGCAMIDLSIEGMPAVSGRIAGRSETKTRIQFSLAETAHKQLIPLIDRLVKRQAA